MRPTELHSAAANGDLVKVREIIASHAPNCHCDGVVHFVVDLPMTNDRRQSSLAVWLTAGALLTPVVYVLSIGPADWLHDRGYLSGQWVLWAYLPLIYLHERFEPARQLLQWYIGLWGV